MREVLTDIHWPVDWQQFHFLRPGVLYLFLPLLLILVILIVGNREPQRWKQLIAPVLRPYVFAPGNSRAMWLPLLFFVVGTSLAIIGIAGPAWNRTVIPGQKVQAVVLVALDLSASMDATDISPTRLERAKLKLSDFFGAHPGAKAGLIAYAGTPHLVMPFTTDYSLIKLQAASLATREMPVPGNNTQLLMHDVDTLMTPVLAPSNILLLTDEVTAADAALFTNYVNTSIHHLEILLMSSPRGAPVPGFPKVVSRQDEGVLQSLAVNPAIRINRLTLDTTDVGRIAERIRAHLIFEKDKKTDDKSWDDMGYLVIIPVGVLVLLWFRRGWAIQWCWLPLLWMVSACSVNSREADWWYTKDYQGQVLYQQQAYQQAGERFVDLPHKAAAAYKAGDYEAAAALFALDSSATGEYNRGLALAKLGRYEEAMNAFTDAATLDPALKNKAANSIGKVSKEKMQVDSVVKIGQPDTKVKEDKKNGPLKERKRKPDDPGLSADTKVKDMPKTGDRLTDQVKSNIHQAQESESPQSGKDTTTAANNDAMKNIILRRPPADPGAFLQKRFELQRKRYYQQVKPGTQQW
ncbi:VWA domain-containing protein [Chitinophaga arvensicola]|uniref:Ca-activated chloride channel family protein n=1 Tax=Chitinophaga arvensicola TaxID=29529 RepID=A0A1I0RQZ5_9BACT|nr:VWA domain-containing protein [Chitinophaga arvensicola]SEW43663.1 Ca-activated chloride channel family protein [Chitinophaga arvensicola]